MPTLNAECSLDLGCPIDEFTAFCDAHPDRTVVVYANTSAAVKARADWVVTSSIAVELIEHLDSPGRKSSGRPIVTGKLCTKQTGADVLCWQGACIVHDEFKTRAPDAHERVIPGRRDSGAPGIPAVHRRHGGCRRVNQPAHSCCENPVTQAAHCGDRSRYLLQDAAGRAGKTLLEAPTAGEGATCRSCAHCPWMAMNGLKAIAEGLENGGAAHEIHVDAALREGALIPLNRMLDFAATLRT